MFLPFLRTRGQSPRTIVLYMLVGAMQLGIMYLLAFRAYLYLTVSEFLLFTVFTPLYITLIYDLLSGRKLRWGYLLSAALAVLGRRLSAMTKSAIISGPGCYWYSCQTSASPSVWWGISV